MLDWIQIHATQITVAGAILATLALFGLWCLCRMAARADKRDRLAWELYMAARRDEWSREAGSTSYAPMAETTLGGPTRTM